MVRKDEERGKKKGAKRRAKRRRPGVASRKGLVRELSFDL
jgi:hypothetical protein